MKKIILSALLSLGVLFGSVVPAFGYQVYSWGEIGPDTYTIEYLSKNKITFNLEGRKIYGSERASFSEGLLRIFEGTEGTPDNFIDEAGTLIDLNRGRFDFMSTFSNGLSSVSKYVYNGDTNHITGFVNKSGDMVLDTSQYGSFRYYRVMTSKFVGGKALLSNYGDFDLKDIERDAPDYSKWGDAKFVVIDTKGNVLETIKGADKLVAHPLFKTSITDYDGVPLGVLMNPLAYAGTNGSSEVQAPAQPAPAPKKEYQRPALPDYADAETHFQAKGKITGIILGDLDFGSFLLTVQNPTGKKDSGVIAVAAANVDGSTSDENSSGVFFVPYELAPYATAEYEIEHRDILHLYMFEENNRYTGANAGDLSGKVEARIIHFTDDDDLWDFYQTVPYEQDWEAGNLVSEFQPVCNGTPGKEFLKKLSINRARNQSGDHSFCIE